MRQQARSSWQEGELSSELCQYQYALLSSELSSELCQNQYVLLSSELSSELCQYVLLSSAASVFVRFY